MRPTRPQFERTAVSTNVENTLSDWETRTRWVLAVPL